MLYTKNRTVLKIRQYIFSIYSARDAYKICVKSNILYINHAAFIKDPGHGSPSLFSFLSDKYILKLLESLLLSTFYSTFCGFSSVSFLYIIGGMKKYSVS